MNVVNLLASTNYLVVNKELVRLLGLEEAVLIGELAGEYLYWEGKGELKDGFFFSTIQNVEQAIGLSDYKQRECLKRLSAMGLVDVRVLGAPPVRYIRINEMSILKIFENQFSKNLNLDTQKISDLNLKKFETNNNKYNNNRNNNKSYIAPTLEEIQKFFREQKFRASAEVFYNHYSATDWFVGQTKIIDWQAKAREWENREKKPEQASYDLAVQVEQNKNKRPVYKQKNQKK